MEGTDGTQNEAMQNVGPQGYHGSHRPRHSGHPVSQRNRAELRGVPDSHPAYNGFTYTFDTEKAKADIAASGYDMSRPIRICYYNNDQTSIDLINTSFTTWSRLA